MMIDHLESRWEKARRFRRFEPSMGLEEEGLVLGGGTVLTWGERDRLGQRRLSIDGAESRILTLLAVAHGEQIDLSVLRHIRKAAAQWSRGEECQAALHLAFARLPRLDEDAARRLFIADGMMAAGIEASEVLQVFRTTSPGLNKFFDEQETRIPAGNSRESGEWARVGAALRGLFAGLSEADGVALAGFTAPFAVPTLTLGKMFFPDRAGGRDLEGPIEGAPGLQYRWTDDEAELRIVDATGKIVLTAYHGQDGLFRDDRGQVVGNALDGQVVLDAAAVRAELPKSDDEDQEPKLCPAPGKDKSGRTSAAGEKDKDYEDCVKSLVNPLNPTPRGFGVQLPNPLKNQFPVFYDDCRRQTGILIEAKGTGYAEPLLRSAFMKRIFEGNWLNQANRQIAASQGRPLQWHFAEKAAADDARKLFENNDLVQIQVIYTPWSED